MIKGQAPKRAFSAPKAAAPVAKQPNPLEQALSALEGKVTPMVYPHNSAVALLTGLTDIYGAVISSGKPAAEIVADLKVVNAEVKARTKPLADAIIANTIPKP